MKRSWQFYLGFYSSRWQQIRSRLNIQFIRGYIAGWLERSK